MVIDEPAPNAAVRPSAIDFAALDGTAMEPLVPGSPMRDLENVPARGMLY